MRINLFWDYLGRFSGILTQFITSIFLSRLLLPEDFGVIGIALAVNGIAQVFSNFGFSSYIIQQEEENQRTINTIFWFSIAIGLLLSVAIFLASPRIAIFYNMAELRNILNITSVLIVLGIMSSVPSALLLKRQEFKKINIRNIAIALFSGSIGIFLAYRGFGVWALVTQQFIKSILSVVITFIIAKWRPRWIFDKVEFLKSYHFGKYIFLSGLFDGIYGRVEVFLIGKIFSLKSLGLYTRAQTLDQTITGLSASSLLNVLFPELTKIKNDKEKLKTEYYKYFEHISFVFSLLSAGLYLVATPLFFYMFGENWIQSALFFKILVLSGFAYPLASLMLSIIEARGNSKNFFYADVVKKLIFFPGYLVVYFYSLEAFLYTLLLLNALGTLVNLYYLNKEILVGYKKSILILFQYAVPSLILAVVIDYFFPSNIEIISALIKVSVVVITFTVISYKTNSLTLTLILNFIKTKR